MERKTPQRKVIREIFQHAERPLSAQEALNEARHYIPKMGLATAYRVIKELSDEGFLHPVDLPGDAQRFEVTGLAHHHYFQCNSCEKVYGINGCPGNFPNIVPMGFQLESHEVILYGTCQGCVH